MSHDGIIVEAKVLEQWCSDTRVLMSHLSMHSLDNRYSAPLSLLSLFQPLVSPTSVVDCDPRSHITLLWQLSMVQGKGRGWLCQTLLPVKVLSQWYSWILMVCHLQCCTCSVHQPPPPPTHPPPTHTHTHHLTITIIHFFAHTHTHTHTHAVTASEPRVAISQQSVNVSVVKRSCSIR